MGYETHVIIGELGNEMNEYEDDLDNPFEDGSGYPHKKDDKGRLIRTGRFERYLMIGAEMCMGKIYDSALDSVHTHYKKNPHLPDHIVYCYMKDGNSRFKEDGYGDPLIIAPFIDVMEAVREDVDRSDYRRFKWLLSLMDSMEDNISERWVCCAFYGS